MIGLVIRRMMAIMIIGAPQDGTKGAGKCLHLQAQQQFIATVTLQNPANGDSFGYVAISGDYAI